MMSGVSAQVLLGGESTQSSAADNATATATVAATEAVRHFMLGCVTDYSADVTAIKTITFKRGSTTICVIRWNFANGAAIVPLPGILKGGYNEAVSCELEASGTPSVTGRVTLFHFSN